MERYELDGKLINHKYLKETMNFPDYYGENLDALYDCLTDMNCEITIVNSGSAEINFIETFEDASDDNKNLKVIFK